MLHCIAMWAVLYCIAIWAVLYCIAMWAVWYCITMWAVLYCIAQRITIRKRVYMVCSDVIFLFDIIFFICGWLNPQIQKNCINFVGIWVFFFWFFWVDRCPGVLGHTAMPLNLLWNPQTVTKWPHHFYTPPGKAEVYFSPSSPHLSPSVFFIIIDLVRETERFHHQSPEEF